MKYVEPNFRVSGSFTPNDPSFPSLATLQDVQPGGIQAQSAWNTTLGSRDVVVGILDSGIDATHPDLIANLWTNRLGIGGCAVRHPWLQHLHEACTSSDQYGHGTHVAGIVGAVGNNRIGITGVAPRVSLMSLAMLNQHGDGSIAGAIAAIDWAIQAKSAGSNLRVLSASWGGTGFSQALTDAIRRAGNAGILFVAAAGNDSLDIERDPIYPCAVGLANVICVAASQGNDQLAGFSDFGRAHVDLAAPGENVLSTVPRGVVPECGQSIYCPLDGTSMAAPMVTGAAVLVLSAAPSMSVAALRARLVGSVDPVPSLANKVVTGGRLNVCKAVPGLRQATPPAAPSPPTAVRVARGRRSGEGAWSAPSSNGNGVGITGYTVDGPGGTADRHARGSRSSGPGPARQQERRASRCGRSTPPAEARLRPTVGRSQSGGLVVHQNGRLARVRFGSAPKISATTPTDLPRVGPGAWGSRCCPTGPAGTSSTPSAACIRSGSAATRCRRRRPAPGSPGRVDWARGVALMPDGASGYVLDQNGKLYGFSIGDNPRPPATKRGPVFTGDLARGVTITLDRSGWVHRGSVRRDLPVRDRWSGPSAEGDRWAVLAGPGHGPGHRPHPSRRGRVRRRSFRWPALVPDRRGRRRRPRHRPRPGRVWIGLADSHSDVDWPGPGRVGNNGLFNAG